MRFLHLNRFPDLRTVYAILFLSLSFVLMEFGGNLRAQAMTAEDSLAQSHNIGVTSISGYGEARYTYDTRWDTAQASLARAVLFVGHTFSSDIAFFSELEVENAKVVGGEPSGEVAFEQAYLRFGLSKNTYITAGLFLPRIGIINENHLPTSFNGVDRPFVESVIIPSTWRELGVGLWGATDAIPGFNYSAAVVTGLSSARFEYGSGIREGRFEGSFATGSNLALTGSLLYYFGDFKVQASGYYGGTAGLTERQADSLQLNSGPFGTPVALEEADVTYNKSGFGFRALGTAVQIPDADRINRAYASNVPEAMVGAYGEVSFDLLHQQGVESPKSLTPFVRYEYLDLNYRVPANGISNGQLLQRYVVAGVGYKPIPEVAIKADFVFRKTGDPNQALVINPFPTAPTYYTDNGFVNLGIGYSF